MSTLVFDLDATMAASDLPLDTLDPLLSYAGGGGLLSWDLQAGGYSYPSGTANPANGAAIRDLSEVPGNDSVVTLSGTGAITRIGNGFGFTNVVNPGQRIESPASVANAIWGTGTSPQLFLVLAYLKLPTKPNWPGAGYTRPLAFLTWRTSSGGITAENDLLSFNFSPTASSLSALRSTAGTAARDQLGMVPADADYGSVVQLAYWRTATVQGFRLRSANGIIRSVDLPSNANNTESFAGKRMQFGIGTGGDWKSATDSVAKEMRIYRAYVENLAVSGRNPEAVANEDYDSVFRVRGLPFT